MIRPFDIQINGYRGVDFCADGLSAEAVEFACSSLVNDGVESILATLITDSIPNLTEKIRNLVHIREQNPAVARMIAGLHIEGPFLSPASGFIGAHSAEHAVPGEPDLASRLLDAGEGLIKLMTLAPERDSGCRTTKFLADQGVVVAAGHCNPTLEQLERAIDNGLSVVTHFGNGCPVELSRHDNVLQRFLRLRDRLWFTFIPDGVHIPFYVLKNYLDLVGLDRSIMVTDAISAAGMGPGRHEISGMVVEVDGNGIARKPGHENLAGSTLRMPQVRHNLASHLGFEETEIAQFIDANPRAACRVLRILPDG